MYSRRVAATNRWISIADSVVQILIQVHSSAVAVCNRNTLKANVISKIACVK